MELVHRTDQESSMKKAISSILVLAALALATGCGPKAFIKGEYEDPEKENNLNDTFSETDMQKIVAELVGKMTQSPVIANAHRPPVVMVTNLQNKTNEHIDTESIMDMVRVELTNSGRVAFVDKQARGDVAEEYNYQNSGMVSNETKKGPGGQTGADLIINGRLDGINQEAGKAKSTYYKMTLNMTNLKTNLIVWTGQKELRKKYRKQSVGL
jgi:uncharacterized protein (TIGR02722 family)